MVGDAEAPPTLLLVIAPRDVIAELLGGALLHSRLHRLLHRLSQRRRELAGCRGTVAAVAGPVHAVRRAGRAHLIAVVPGPIVLGRSLTLVLDPELSTDLRPDPC